MCRGEHVYKSCTRDGFGQSTLDPSDCSCVCLLVSAALSDSPLLCSRQTSSRSSVFALSLPSPVQGVPLRETLQHKKTERHSPRKPLVRHHCDSGRCTVGLASPTTDWSSAESSAGGSLSSTLTSSLLLSDCRSKIWLLFPRPWCSGSCSSCGFHRLVGQHPLDAFSAPYRVSCQIDRCVLRIQRSLRDSKMPRVLRLDFCGCAFGARDKFGSHGVQMLFFAHFTEPCTMH